MKAHPDDAGMFWQNTGGKGAARVVESFLPDTPWRPPHPDTWPSWAGVPRVAVDLETKDPDLEELGPGCRRKDGSSYVVGYAFGLQDGPRMYLPTRHAGGDNCDPGQVLRYMRAQAAAYDGEICGAHLQYDLDWMLEEGIVFPNVKAYRDVQIAEPLIDENQFAYGLDAIAGRHKLPGKRHATLYAACRAHRIPTDKDKTVKQNLWRLPARYVGDYAEGDVDLPLRLLAVQEPLIDSEGVRAIYELESALLPVFLAMTRQGIPIDQDQLDMLERKFLIEQREAAARIKDLTGVDMTDAWFETGPAVQALTARGIRVGETPTGKPSVRKEWLEELEDPVAAEIRRGRNMDKFIGTFYKGVREHTINGRVHPVYHQLKADNEGALQGTVSGRPSCTHPNVLNQPVRHKIYGKDWRRIYIPEKGAKWFRGDFSSQEPRLTVHAANNIKIQGQPIPGAADMVRQYRENPKTDLHGMVAMLSGKGMEWRESAKTIFLGRAYGLSDGNMVHKMGFPTVLRQGRHGVYRAPGPEGQAMLDEFNAKVPFLTATRDAARRAAERRGYILTIGGRKCRFPNGFFHKALNRYCQGSAADQTKRAMLLIYRELKYVPYMQVYDELDGPITDDALAVRIAYLMEHALELDVPSVVDVSTGPSWGDCK